MDLVVLIVHVKEKALKMGKTSVKRTSEMRPSTTLCYWMVWISYHEKVLNTLENKGFVLIVYLLALLSHVSV